MCKTTNINSTANGLISKCSVCKQYHIEYKNLFFSFNYREYEQYRNYFLEMDPHYWEQKNANMQHRRKVLVPIGSKKLITVFNATEIEELKWLFSYRETSTSAFGFISSKELQRGFAVN